MNSRLETSPQSLLEPLCLRSRKWYGRLTAVLGGPVASFAEFRRRLESPLALLREGDDKISSPAEEALPCKK